MEEKLKNGGKFDSVFCNSKINKKIKKDKIFKILIKYLYKHILNTS